MWKDTKVIDADGHMHEPRDLWERYVEPAYRERAPKVAYMNGAQMVYSSSSSFVPEFQYGTGEESDSSSAGVERMRAGVEKYGEAYKTWWSPETRIEVMDENGWDIQVLLPTGNNGNFATEVALVDAELGAAMCRAYNNWAHEYCSKDPARLKFAAITPGSDGDAIVTEARRAVHELGAVAIRNPFLPEGRFHDEPEFDKCWELAAELDFPVLVHGEYRHRRTSPFRKHFVRDGTVDWALVGLDHSLAFPFDNMATLGFFVLSGILDRHPHLRLGILESNVGWLPFWLGRLDEHTHGDASVVGKALPLHATDYVMRQCWFGCDSAERGLKYAIDDVGTGKIVFSTDYPHPDAPEPDSVLPSLDAQSISEEAKRKILYDNALALYGQRIHS